MNVFNNQPWAVFNLSFSDTDQYLFERTNGLNTQISYVLLKNCIPILKWTYFLRTSPFWNMLHDALKNVLNIELEEKQWSQCTLPMNVWGITIWRILDLAWSDFFSSIHAAKNLGISNSPFSGPCTKEALEYCTYFCGQPNF